MKNSFETKKQPIVRILLSGLIILSICLMVCFFLISSLKTAYVEEKKRELNAEHGTMANVVDDELTSIVSLAKASAKSLAKSDINLDADRILEVIRTADSTGFEYTTEFLSSTGVVYDSESASVLKDTNKFWKDYTGEFNTDRSGLYTTVIDDASTGGIMYTVVVSVYRNDSLKGFLIVSADLKKLISGTLFEHILGRSEIFIVSKNGEIFYQSEANSKRIGDNTNFFTALNEYCRGKSKAEASLKEMKKHITAKEDGSITLRTSEGYSMQVDYSNIKSLDKVAFVTCFKDNLVNDLIQPSIYKCTFACIIIIVLMVCIIIFVWGTAKNANITIEKLAYEDYVTKGKNINYFKEFSNHVMNVFKETPFIIYRFDIMNFRYINEAYGHTKADEVLASCIKEFDGVFSSKELCVRMDSDQFVALLVNDASIEKNFDDFSKKVNEDARGRGIKYPIKFKTGIYQVRKHDHDIDVMIDHANVARKTLSGDEKVLKAVFSESVVNNMRKVDKIESEMQRALATGEFKVFVQPKWDIGSNTICGGEALVRWIKADGSMVFPDEFIPIFENNGFIEKLDFYMLEKVCEIMRDTINQRKAVYPISVNQSRILLHNPDYVENVKKIIRTYDIPAGYIELEITETVFDSERILMVKTMKALREVGVKLAMDDFGSGYSSLNMLKEIPFDIIKIDREFFSESVTGNESLLILKKIIEMVNGLGKELVCEGVETEEQSSLLHSMGCRVVQGYLYSKPVNVDEFIEKYCITYQ